MKNLLQSFKTKTIFGIRICVIALVAYWLLLFTGTHLPKLPEMVPLINDKILHFTAFFGLTILLSLVGSGNQLRRRFSKVAIIAFAYGIFDELTQSLVPGRFTELADLAADSLGIAAAILVSVVVKQIGQKPSS